MRTVKNKNTKKKELDGARRKHLTNFLKDYQTIITTTDADVVTKNFSQN